MDIRLGLLDGFDLRLGLRARTLPLPLSCQRVLAFLALRRRRVMRSFVAGSLWLDAPEHRAAANLRSALWRIGRLGAPIVEANGAVLRLAPSVWVDANQLVSDAHSVIAGREAADETIEIWLRGPQELLPDWYDDWVIGERERLRQLHLHALENLCDRLMAAGRLAEAVEAGLAAVTAEPLRESAQRVLMRAHLAEGNRGEALRQFERFRTSLRSELDLEPTDEMREMVGGTRSR